MGFSPVARTCVCIRLKLIFGIALCFTNCLVVLAQPIPNVTTLIQAVDSNHVPDRQKIIDAAIAINGTGSGVPTQTIRVGTYDGATDEFIWVLPGVYPPGLPDHKKAEFGGPVQPRYFAELNSFNVKYEFGIRNRPPNLSIAVEIPDETGHMEYLRATMHSGGELATVSFHPYTTTPQRIRITSSIGSKQSRVTPYLKPQLGAFIVPHLLLAIVYEPPGSQSSSAFSMSSTVGTTFSFEFAGGWGLVQVEDTGRLLDAISTVGKGGAEALRFLGDPVGWQEAGSMAPYVKAFGAVAMVLDLLKGSQTTTTTTVTSKGQSQFSGWSVTIQNTYSTGLHKYPGEGDKFVILDDVLFVYAVINNKVMLAPVAFTQDRSQTIGQLQNELPAPLVNRLRELDVILNPTANMDLRTTYFRTARCETQGPVSIDLTDTEISGSGTSQTTTQTIQVMYKPSLMDSLLGTTSPDEYYSTSYTNSIQNWQEQAQSTLITLGCPEFDPSTHYVEISIDNAFGTFVSRLGLPAPTTASLTGTLRDVRGRPLTRTQITLKVRNRVYTEFSGTDGRFAFYTESVPRGTGTLYVHKRTFPVQFTGIPIRDLTVNVPRR